MIVLFLVCLFFFPAAVWADPLVGQVISISDGDTITVLVNREQVKVRLVEIDAPEKVQAFGNRSKQSLSDMCFDKEAQVQDKGKDRYGRTLGRVYCNGTDANAEQIRQGMAWVYDKYVTDHSLYRLQDEARAAKRGLWADPNSGAALGVAAQIENRRLFWRLPGATGRMATV